MAKNMQLKLASYDDPEELARRACQHLEEAETPMTFKDALREVGISDPHHEKPAVQIMRNLTAENGPFAHLTREKRYVETSPKAAVAREVPKGRSVVPMGERRLKAMDDAQAKIGRMENLPEEAKENFGAIGLNTVAGAERIQNVARTAEHIELQKELAASLDKHFGKMQAKKERLEVELAAEKALRARAEAEVTRLQELLAQALAGRFPPPPAAPGRAVVPAN